MVVMLKQRHFLAAFVLCSVLDIIFSSPATTAPEPVTSTPALSSISPPQSSSSSSSSSFIATSSHTSTSVSSSSSSSSAEREAQSQDAPFVPLQDAPFVPSQDAPLVPSQETSFTPDIVSAQKIDGTQENALDPQSFQIQGEIIHSENLSSTFEPSLTLLNLESGNVSSANFSLTHTDQPSLPPDFLFSSPFESPPSNQLPSSLPSEPSVTTTSHSPLHPENNIPSPESESFTVKSSAASPLLTFSSEAPEPFTDIDFSLFNETFTSPVESHFSSSSDKESAILSDTKHSLSNEPSSKSPVEFRSSSTIDEAPTSLSGIDPSVFNDPSSTSGAKLHSSSTANMNEKRLSLSDLLSRQSQKGNANQKELIPTESLQPSFNSSTEEFYNLTQEFFQWKLDDSPQYATEVGINGDYAARLDDISLEQYQRRKIRIEDFLQRALKINASQLTEIDSLNHRIFIDDLRSFVRNFKYIRFFMPISIMEGPQQSLQFTVKKSTNLKTYNDYKNLISRYRDFQRQAEQFIQIMKGNINDGIMPSNWSLSGVTEQFDELIVPFNESVFYYPFKNISSDMTTEQKEALKQEAEPVVEELIMNFRRIRDFIQDIYYPAARSEEGVSSLPGGLDYYKACLEFHTSTDMSPQDVHDLGLIEVERIHREVEKTAQELGMANKTLAEISAVVKREPKMKFSSKEDLLVSYRDAVYNTIYPLVDQIIDGAPDVNVTVEENVAGDGYASYKDPPQDGSRPGTFFLNAKIYEHHRRYEVTALSLHETVPGHHLQAIMHLSNPNLPEYRRNPDFYRYSDIPTKIPMHTAYTEGWGLYSEFLGIELGLYKDPYQRLGRHSFEMLRACRLVVDTGLHALGWSRQEAINYLLENTAMSKKAIENQIDRYISWPGQATSYKVGEIKIRMLRRRAEAELGKLFRVQDFHATVLGCHGPLNILEECVDSYIKKSILKNTKNQNRPLLV